MPTALTWQSIALRLLLTTLCAGVLGFDRDERGRSAGLRTNLLVGLAACLAMIQANWLMNSNGKPENSFVVMDTLRLPLGILSGIGFIGAGAILRCRGELTEGVTTAATIWFVTVMGLCFGGGQLGLGVAGFALGFGVLTGLKKVEMQMARQHSGTLRVTVPSVGPKQDEIASLLIRGGVSLAQSSLAYDSAPTANRVYGWKVRWKAEYEDTNPPRAIQELASHPSILKFEFTR